MTPAPPEAPQTARRALPSAAITASFGNDHSNACFQGEVHFNSTRVMHSGVCNRTAEVRGSIPLGSTNHKLLILHIIIELQVEAY